MRLFEILDQMNVSDTEKGTGYLGVCKSVVSVDKKGLQNGTITMGVPASIVDDMVLRNKDIRPILLLVDGAEYDKIKNDNNG